MSTVENIAVTTGVMDSEEIAGPLQRLLEYQAYIEMKEWLRSLDELPSDLLDEELPVDAIKDWITGKIASTSFNFREKIEKTLLQLKRAGSDGIDDLCRRYCEFKKKMALGADGATILLSFDAIKQIILDSVFDSIIFSGVPITALISFLIRTGVLDKLCDCESLLGEPYSMA